MIRFRTIEPDMAAKAAEPPAAISPLAKAAPARGEAAPALEAAVPSDAEAAAGQKPKGLTRKAPLRAKKPEAARLFQE